MTKAKGTTGSRHRLRSTLGRVGFILVFAFVIEYLVVPQLSGARKALFLVAHVNLLLVLAGVALEAASLTCYAQLTRSTLPRGSGLSLAKALKIDLTTMSLSHMVPGGAAAGAGLGF